MPEKNSGGTVLVTGATGFVGSHLAAELKAWGYRVRSLARAAGESLAGEVTVGDVGDPGSLKKACSGVDTVFHLVAVIREKGGATFESVNYRGTVNMLEAAGECGVRRFVHMSALGAVSNPEYKYAYSKWQAEEAVRASELSWAILRPSVIYGRGFGFFSRMIQSFRLSPPFLAPVPGGGGALFQPVAVEDVVECLIRVAGDGGFDRQVIEIGGPEHVSYSGMADALLKVLGSGRIKVPVPIALMRVVVPVMERVFRDPPVTMVELKQMELGNTTDPDSISKIFGFRPRRLEEGLGEIRDYLRSI